MEEQILQKIEEQNQKIDALVKVVDKMRKYFLAIFWLTVVLFVLPLILATFLIPTFLSTYLDSFGGLI